MTYSFYKSKARLAHVLAVAGMAAWLAAGCEVETSSNGALDGFWQLTSVDTLRSGGSADMRERLVFWSVQKHLLETTDATGQCPNVLFRFVHTDGRLVLYQPIIDKRDTSDRPLNDIASIHVYGIEQIPDTFQVRRLDGGRMVLDTERLRLHFRKY